MVIYPPDKALEEFEYMLAPQQIGYLPYRDFHSLEVGAGKTLPGFEKEQLGDWITFIWRTQYGALTLFSASAIGAPSVEISYSNKENIEDLLDSKGCQALYKVIDLIKRSAVESAWPLVRVEVRHTRDFEARDWEYVLIALVFACSFETADRHLHEFYDRLDVLTDELSGEEQMLLRRVIFFDIKVVSEIFSTGPY
jgi:hypothetical protein